jgi:hypothetical protein
MIFYVYIYYENTVAIYVGKGYGNRAYDHLKPSLYSQRTPFHNKLREMIDRGIEPDIDIINVSNEEEAFEEERRLIRFYGRRCDGTGTLFNLTEGGEGLSGHQHSEETKLKISLTRIGVRHPHSEEAKEKMLKIKGSLESRRNMSEKMQGNQNGAGKIMPTRRPVKRLYRGKLIKTYAFLKQVAVDGFNPAGVHAVLEGKLSHHKGYQWEDA